MTMDAQRRADVLAYLRDILAGCEGGWARVRTDPAMWPAAIRDAVSALEAPKSSMDSLVERVRALEEGLGAAHRSLVTIAQQRAGDGVDLLGYARNRAEVAYRVLYGPPDPERDREFRSEVERPDVPAEEVVRRGTTATPHVPESVQRTWGRR